MVEQSFEFPQDEFRVEDGALYFHDIPMMDVIEQYGTPLKISYLPKISSQIQRAKRMFNVAMAKVDYQGDYHYCYCTKSSHFSFVLEEALKNDIHIETSSAFDFNLIESLYDSKTVDKDLYIICNGYKKDTYIANIAQFINNGWHNTIPILDNMPELDQLDAVINEPTRIGIRIAAEEEPKFEFYTSRLGIRYKDTATTRNSASKCCTSSSTPASRTTPTTGTSWANVSTYTATSRLSALPSIP